MSQETKELLVLSAICIAVGLIITALGLAFIPEIHCHTGCGK